MIEAKNLTKKFGTQTAVDHVTFQIPEGQLVGFLGPNGAGKTTTMRLLTGYLPPDAGEATLLGHDLATESLIIRKKLGYLPENNPLPDDMEVSDYLHFVGQLRGLHEDGQRLDRVRHVVKLCSLKAVIGKRMSELSKGYRQRVGLAQAIIHDPDILILDEPTSGLDPNQILEVRGLIQDLKKHKTLLISTHILSEVRQTCDRLLIINKGKIVADGTPDAITGTQQNVTRLSVNLRGPIEQIESKLKELNGVLRVYGQKNNQGEDGFVIESSLADDLRESVFRLATANNWPITGMVQERLSLEEVFRSLTNETLQNGKGELHASIS